MNEKFQQIFGEAYAAHQRGDFALAERVYQRILGEAPEHFDAILMLGVVMLQTGRLAEAEPMFRRATVLNPSAEGAHFNLGIVLHGQKRFAEALASYDTALGLKPDFVEVLANRGVVLHELKRFDDALIAYAKTLALDPKNVQALQNRGHALLALGRHEEALKSYDRALSLEPGNVDVLLDKGRTLEHLGRTDEAMVHFDRAVELAPGYAAAREARSAGLIIQGKYRAATRDLETLLRLEPDHPYTDGNLVFAKLNAGDWQGYDEDLRRLKEGVRAGRPVSHPFAFFVASDSPADQLSCARAYAARNYPAADQPLWKGERYGHEKIRLAYVSADFHEHATAALVAELFERHDKAKFELTAISFGPDSASPLRKRLEAAFDEFIDVRNMGDDQAARLLQEKEIDVAVDLKGYGTNARPGIFARRAAPVQVNYLVFPGTLGAPYFDYILADEILIPPEDDVYYSEKVVRLPNSYQVNDSTRRIADKTPTRGQAGLPESAFVFCCFNNSYKITPPVFDVWMRLLKRVEGSALWLLEGNDAVRGNLSREAERRGVAPDRLVFAARTDLEAHLARHRLADLFLDTLPCNAHTTASDALWAGLPLVTCLGTTFAGRVTASLLHAIGLPELVTKSLDAYEALALRLAEDRGFLAAITSRLAANRTASSLFDAAQTCRHIEAAYTRMQEISRRGALAESFAIPPIK